jgi:putative transposase
MKANRSFYNGHRYPREIISHAVWLYSRFGISLRDVEDLLAERGITVSYETVRRWCRKFGPEYARKLKRRQDRLGDTWFLDEVFVTINGKRQYLWRAVDQDGDVIDILVQSRRNRLAAERFLRKLLKGQGKTPLRIITDKLKSYGAALRTIMPSVNHDTDQYANNRAEVSHQPIRQRERQMRRFKSPRQAQIFLSVHGVVLNLFRLSRHRLKAVHHRMLRARSFATGEAIIGSRGNYPLRRIFPQRPQCGFGRAQFRHLYRARQRTWGLLSEYERTTDNR